jgi:hypothetical protein
MSKTFRYCPNCGKKGVHYRHANRWDPEGGWNCRYCWGVYSRVQCPREPTDPTATKAEYKRRCKEAESDWVEFEGALYD